MSARSPFTNRERRPGLPLRMWLGLLWLLSDALYRLSRCCRSLSGELALRAVWLDHEAREGLSVTTGHGPDLDGEEDWP